VDYRRYEPRDFAALYAIEEICFAPPLRFSRAYMRRLAASASAATWMAEKDGELAGFAIVEWSPSGPGAVAYIQTIEVAPPHRGFGAGSELLLRVEGSARAAGARLIWLHVDAENTVAIRLYEAHGYTRQGREEHYYARHRPALVYAKPLASAAPLTSP